MLLVILLVLALLLYLTGLPAQYLVKQAGLPVQIGTRDDLPPPTREIKRASAAVNNLLETLPIFLTLALLSLMLGEEGPVSLIGAWVYFLARIGHAYCYVKGLAPLRSVIFGFAMLGIFAMAFPIVPYVWS